MTSLEVLHNYAGDSIVICDAVTHDDVAELFYKERHTVSRTEEQALATARMFTASPALYDALEELVEFCDYAHLRDKARAALRLARGEVA